MFTSHRACSNREAKARARPPPPAAKLQARPPARKGAVLECTERQPHGSRCASSIRMHFTLQIDRNSHSAASARRMHALSASS